ncbi:MAG: lytic transglycosylase domain-containing protein [Myxococcota bacterium]
MRGSLVLIAALVALPAAAGDIGEAVTFAKPFMGDEVSQGLEQFIDENPDEALSVLLGRTVSGGGLETSGEHDLTELGGPRLSYAQLKGPILAAAEETGLPAALIDAVIRTESGYRIRAVSRVGAKGLMQLMPGTAAEVGIKDPFDARQNILGGARYLRKLYDRFGNLRLAVAAYNAGPGSVDKYQGLPPFAETRAYVRTVMARYSKSKLSGINLDE